MKGSSLPWAVVQVVLRRPQWKTRCLSPRSSGFATLQTPRVEDVSISSRGSNGEKSLRLRIFHPPNPTGNDPIILSFPPGPLLRKSSQSDDTFEHENERFPSALATLSNATVVHVNYRLYPPKYTFPTLIHDALAAYDWTLHELLPPHEATNDKVELDRETSIKAKGGRRHPHLSPSNSPPTAHVPTIGVVGELLGGTLAAGLGLTECHADKPGRIGAMALSDPIAEWPLFAPLPNTTPAESPERASAAITSDSTVDWSLFDTEAESRPRSKKGGKQPAHLKWSTHPDLPLTRLQDAYNSFFKSPDAATDPFASPSFFFQTPAGESGRKSFLKYPPRGSGLALPYLHMVIASKTPLNSQTRGFIKVFVRALERELRAYPASWTDERIETEKLLGSLEGLTVDDPIQNEGTDMKEDERADVSLVGTREERGKHVTSHHAKGLGLWNTLYAQDHARFLTEVECVAEWFKEKLVR